MKLSKSNAIKFKWISVCLRFSFLALPLHRMQLEAAQRHNLNETKINISPLSLSTPLFILLLSRLIFRTCLHKVCCRIKEFCCCRCCYTKYSLCGLPQSSRPNLTCCVIYGYALGCFARNSAVATESFAILFKLDAHFSSNYPVESDME